MFIFYPPPPFPHIPTQLQETQEAKNDAALLRLEC